MNCRKKIFAFLFLLVMVSSCSDWSRESSSIEEPTSDDSLPQEGILVETEYPKDISAFVFKNSKIFIAGTSDGVFYKSTDAGITWKKTFEMKDKAKINFFCIPSQSIYDTDVIAGTDKGGYMSTDIGSSWVEIIPAKNSAGQYRILTSGVMSGVLYTFYGNDGVNSMYQYYRYAAVIQYNNIQTSISNGVLVGNSITGVAGHIVQGFNNSTRSAIKSSNSNKVKIFEENMEISVTASLKTSDEKILYLAGTKNGLLASKDSGGVWFTLGFDGQKVNSIVFYNSYKTIFAGTDNGLFISNDYGVTWEQLESNRIMGVKSMVINNNYIYLVTKSGFMSYFIIPSSMGIKEYIPIPYYPPCDSVCSSAPVLQWTRVNDYNKTMYRLQISSDELFSGLLTDTITNKINYAVSMNKSDKKYYWRLKSLNIFYESAWSVVYNFKY